MRKPAAHRPQRKGILRRNSIQPGSVVSVVGVGLTGDLKLRCPSCATKNQNTFGGRPKPDRKPIARPGINHEMANSVYTARFVAPHRDVNA